jgi:hypothetical protein
VKHSSGFVWLLADQPEELELLSQRGAIAAATQVPCALYGIVGELHQRTLGALSENGDRFFEQCFFINFPTCAVDARDTGSSATVINQEENWLSLVLAEFHGLVSPDPSFTCRGADGKYLPLTNRSDSIFQYLLDIIARKGTSERQISVRPLAEETSYCTAQNLRIHAWWFR